MKVKFERSKGWWELPRRPQSVCLEVAGEKFETTQTRKRDEFWSTLRLSLGHEADMLLACSSVSMSRHPAILSRMQGKKKTNVIRQEAPTVDLFIPSRATPKDLAEKAESRWVLSCTS